MYFFSYFGAAAVYVPYLSLYLNTLHLNGAQIGAITSTLPLAGALLPPVWGIMSDRFCWRQQILVLSTVLAALCALAGPLATTFPTALTVVLLLAVITSPVMSLSNAAVLEWMHAHGGTYGTVRGFGSLGFLLVSVTAGALYERAGMGWMFRLYSCGLLVVALLGALLPRQSSTVHQGSGAGLGVVLRDRVMVHFLLWAGLGYGAYAAYLTYFSLYLKELGAGAGMFGLGTGLATLSEVPAMALMGPVICRIGVKWVLLAGIGISALRWLSLGFMHDYHLVLALQPVHGIAFAAYYVAGIAFIEQRIPPQYRATGQSLFNGLSGSLGLVVAAIPFGLLLDDIGAGEMFVVAAAIGGFATLMLAATIPSDPEQVAVE
jgi:PPP family 3-phenylpropionic acid transporter